MSCHCNSKCHNTTGNGIDVTLHPATANSEILVAQAVQGERDRILGWVATHSVDEEYTAQELVWVDDLLAFIGGIK
jgi:hypothetical protein